MFFDAHELKNVTQYIELFGFWRVFGCGVIVSKHFLDNLLEFLIRKSRFEPFVIMFVIFEKVEFKEPISWVFRFP